MFLNANLLRRQVVAKNGMVSAAHPLAAEAGRRILYRGGNAIDAAVAMAFAISVVEPFASGLGGGGYAVIHLNSSKQTVFVDYQSTAPGLSQSDMYMEDPSSKSTGLLSTMTPGYLAGLTTMLSNFGTLSLAEVLDSSIKYAEAGFRVTPYFSKVIKSNYKKLLSDSAASQYFLKNGRPFKAGEHFSNPDLAKTLCSIAVQGEDFFYRGEISQRIEAMMLTRGGLMRQSDMATIEPVLRPPISLDYRGFQIKSSAPTSSGGITIAMILNMLEQYDLRKLGHNSERSLHLWAEAARRAYADRASYIGDPAFVQPPIRGLLSKEFAKERMLHFDPAKATLPEKGDPYPYNESPSTTHLSVIDGNGNAVAITQTLCAFFGNGVAVPGFGFMLNNQGEAWFVDPKAMNGVAPYKRPLSSMSPTVVLHNGKPFLCLGSPGSRRIITTTAQVISNVIDHGMSLQEAIEAPRFYADGPRFAVEGRVKASVVAALQELGHSVEAKGAYDDYFGGVNAVMYDSVRNMFFGGADPRRDGYAVGLLESSEE